MDNLIKYSDSSVRSTPILVKCSPSNAALVLGFQKDSTLVCNELLKLFMAFRQKKYIMDGIEHDGEKEFASLCNSRKLDPLKMKKSCSQFVESILKQNNATNSFYNFIFSKNGSDASVGNPRYASDKKTPDVEKTVKLSDEFGILVPSFFPIKRVESRDRIVDIEKLNGNEYRSILKAFLASFSSYIEKETAYQAAKDVYSNNAKLSGIPMDILERYEDFLMEIGKLKYFSSFESGEYKRFICNWKKGSKSEEIPLRSKLLEANKKHGMKHVFSDEEQDSFIGYRIDFIQMIFSEFSDLWLDNDIIGDEKIVELVSKSFHWKKEGVNMPSFDSYGKTVPILLGDNCIKHDVSLVDSENGVMKVSFKLLGNPVSFHTHRNGYLGNLEVHSCDKVEVNEKTGKTTIDKTGNKKLVFSSDSRRKTRYQAYMNEPRIRFNSTRDQFEIDLCLSDVEEVGCGEKKVCSFRNYSPKVTDKNKESFEKDGFVEMSEFQISCFMNKGFVEKDWKDKEFKLRAMGIDLGISNLFAATVREFSKKHGEASCSSKIVSQYMNVPNTAVATLRDGSSIGLLELYDSANLKFQTATALVKKIIRFHRQNGDFKSICKDNFENTVKLRKNGDAVCWTKVLGIDYDTLVGELKALPKPVDNCAHVIAYWMRLKPNSGTFLKSIKALCGELARLMSEVRSSTNNQDPSEANRVDKSTFHKLIAVKSYIRFQQSIGNGILNAGDTKKLLDGTLVISKDGNKSRDNLSNLRSYYNGLLRHIKSYLGSAIVNAARDNKAGLIVIENLDLVRGHDEKDNAFMDMWSVSGIVESVINKARKHRIIVMAVDPFKTSQIDSETGEAGIRDGREIEVVRNGRKSRIDADINASDNILKQGMSAQTSISRSNVTKVGDNIYETFNDVNSIGTVKAGFMTKAFGSKDNIRFMVGESGEVIESTVGKVKSIRSRKGQGEDVKKPSRDGRLTITNYNGVVRMYLDKFEPKAIIPTCTSVYGETKAAKKPKIKVANPKRT